MGTTRAQIVTEAREWLGTPYHHQGRLKGIGSDCVGILIGIAAALGLPYEDVTNYSPNPMPEQFKAELASLMDPIPVEDALLGDVYTFYGNREQHVGIIVQTDPAKIVHVWAQFPRKCVEIDLDQSWIQRRRAAYRFRGVID